MECCSTAPWSDIRPSNLLREAARIYDDPRLGLQIDRLEGAAGIFAFGEKWMARALGLLRGGLSSPPASAAILAGVLKYGLCSIVAALVFMVPDSLAIGALGAVVAFYAIEAQFVFLFPLLIEGEERPWRRSIELTQAAGGTLRVMSIVLPIAASMLFGGFLGRGFMRSWCIGCLAILIWYSAVNQHLKN
ncbi:MAG: hypothetical protein QY326_08160 [Bdellovibrionota bacterium]|nr:MAG: hypothetical protein QY326_08160 [Bdellovibrionota bacterium]